MMDWVPTSVHFDLTHRHNICITGLEEVDKPSFHSPAVDRLCRATWDIKDDGTPEKMRERRYSSLEKVVLANQMPVSGVCPLIILITLNVHTLIIFRWFNCYICHIPYAVFIYYICFWFSYVIYISAMTCHMAYFCYCCPHLCICPDLHLLVHLEYSIFNHYFCSEHNITFYICIIIKNIVLLYYLIMYIVPLNIYILGLSKLTR